jgi:hypothetical protein
MKNFLIALMSAVCIGMIYVVVSTSLASNLFKEWDNLAQIPWLVATLWDFYANTLVLLLWVYYKEKSFAMKGLWTVLFVCLGSIAVSAYVVIQLLKLKSGDGFEKVLLRNA